jgi:hypothetical protein
MAEDRKGCWRCEMAVRMGGSLRLQLAPSFRNVPPIHERQPDTAYTHINPGHRSSPPNHTPPTDQPSALVSTAFNPNHVLLPSLPDCIPSLLLEPYPHPTRPNPLSLAFCLSRHEWRRPRGWTVFDELVRIVLEAGEHLDGRLFPDRRECPCLPHFKSSQADVGYCSSSSRAVLSCTRLSARSFLSCLRLRFFLCLAAIG